MARKPFLVLLAVVGLAVLLAVVLSRIDPVPERAGPEDLIVETVPTSTPEPPKPAPDDFSTTRRLTKEEVVPLYEALAARAENYETVQARIRFDLDARIHGRPTEAEVHIDAVRPDKAVRKVYASVPTAPIDPQTDWVVVPRYADSYFENRMRTIEYPSRGVFDIDMAGPEESLQDYFKSLKEKRDGIMEDPWVDLLRGIPLEEKLREIIQAEEVKTSRGRGIRVTSRINSEMGSNLKSPALALYFPALPDLLKDVVLKRDVFLADSGELDRVEYLTMEQEAYVTQTFPEIIWDEPIPDDRFILAPPEHAREFDMNRLLSHKMEVGIPRQEALKMIENGEMDWATLKQRMNDY